MLKLNASYSKKVPAEGEYSSQSFHASVEVELSDGLSGEQLQARIHETFELVRNSVEAELNGTSPSQSNGAQSGRQGTPLASPKQLQYLTQIAGTRGINLNQLTARFHLNDIRQLSRQQCSSLIEELTGRNR